MIGTFLAVFFVCVVLYFCFTVKTNPDKKEYMDHAEASYMFVTVRSSYQEAAIKTDDPNKAVEAAMVCYQNFAEQYPNNRLIKDFNIGKMLDKLEYHFFLKESIDGKYYSPIANLINTDDDFRSNQKSFIAATDSSLS